MFHFPDFTFDVIDVSTELLLPVTFDVSDVSTDFDVSLDCFNLLGVSQSTKKFGGDC